MNKKYNYSISYNLIIGSESSLRSNKLERLDLGDNLFNQSIIQSLRLLKSLKTMSTIFNQLEGTFPVKGMPILHNNHKNSQKFLIFTYIFVFLELSILEDLEMLDLGGNQLNGSLTLQGTETKMILF